MKTLLGFHDNSGRLIKSKVMAASILTMVSRQIPIILPSGKDLTRCTAYFKITTASSTKSVTPSIKMVYGSNIFGASFNLTAIVGTTSGVDGTYILERAYSGDFDPNAEAMVFTFTKTTGIIVTVEMGVNIG